MIGSRPSRSNPMTQMLEQAFSQLMRQAMFCLPGKIVSFDPETQLAQVECGIQRIVAGQGETISVIENVPVCFSGDGQWYFFHQIVPGETEGLIHFSQRAMDAWIEQGGPVAPHENRIMDESDAIFVPGVRSKPGAIPNFKNDGAGISNYAGDNFVHLKDSGDAELKITGSADVGVGGSATVDVTDNLTATVGGNMTATVTGNADLTAAAINLTGPTTVDGTLTVTGAVTGQATGSFTGAVSGASVSDSAGSMQSVRDTYNSHTHVENDDGGPTNPPAQQM